MIQRLGLFSALSMACAITAFMGVSIVGTSPAGAMSEAPTNTNIDCRKRKNKKKKECQNQSNNQLNDDQLYQTGYWLARAGKYGEALAQFRKAKNQNDPRILNYIGYTTRKLGRVEEAMTYYRKALSINPNYTVARAYLGEAFLEQGQLDLAKGQLTEIEKRCGTTCVEFAELSAQIKAFATTGKFEPQGKADKKVPQKS
ncbi:MAG: tetratricopeptide repeat protein [Hyphomicrobiaceae bacterium]